MSQWEINKMLFDYNIYDINNYKNQKHHFYNNTIECYENRFNWQIKTGCWKVKKWNDDSRN